MSSDDPSSRPDSSVSDSSTPGAHEPDPRELDRRALIATAATLGLADTLLPGVLWARMQQETGEPAVTTAMIAEAERIAGLELTAEEREMMRRGVARNRESFEQLRRLALRNDIPPCLLFEPAMPGVATARVGRTESEPPPIRLSHTNDRSRPASDEELAFLPVSRLASLLRRREISSTELTAIYLERLKRYDTRLRFLVTDTEELALRQAARADREIAAGDYRGPLHGVPWGAKDLFATRGYGTTWGAEPYRHQVIDRDATVVQRLEEAGAVLIAKLTLGALAMGDYWFGGQTRSPWNNEHGSSGSSAGPGSATAAGCVGFALGTETRGSIVSPCTRNGTTGLRPTFGRVARTGAMALSWSMDKVGPMCRSVEDCALVFAAIHGADGEDPSARTLPFAWNPDGPLETLRVGYYASAFEDAGNDRNEGEGRAIDREVLRVLREDVGIELIPIELPDFPVEAMGFMLTAEAAAAFDELTRSGLDDQLTRQGPFAWPNSFRTARMVPAVEYIQASRARTAYQRLFSEAIEDVDVFVAPSYADGLLAGTNLTGHPCVVVPCGFAHDGMPRSISFIGDLYADADALRVAHAFQSATSHHLERPDLDSLPEVPGP